MDERSETCTNRHSTHCTRQMDTMNTVEEELKAIEETFASGRMNAFGTSADHEQVMKEFRFLADLEVQVFVLTSNMLEKSNERDYEVQRSLLPMSSSPAPGSTQDHSRGQQQGQNSSGADETPLRSVRGLSASALLPAQSPMEGLSDASFETVAQHFALFEESFTKIGENMRKMSLHVKSLNEKAERLNNGSIASMR